MKQIIESYVILTEIVMPTTLGNHLDQITENLKKSLQKSQNVDFIPHKSVFLLFQFGKSSYLLQCNRFNLSISGNVLETPCSFSDLKIIYKKHNILF